MKKPEASPALAAFIGKKMFGKKKSKKLNMKKSKDMKKPEEKVG